MINYLFTFTIVVALILFTYIVGFYYIYFLLPNFKSKIQNDFYKSFAFSTSLGFLVSTSLIAVIFTSFNTLFIYPCLIFLIPFFLKKEKKTAYNFKPIFYPNRKQMGIISVFLLLLYCYNAMVYYRSDGYFFYDLVYYGKLASSIFTYGIENRISIYGAFIDVKSQMLYHYGDLWLVGGISRLFQLPEVNTIVYIIYPFFQFLILVVLLSIYSSNGQLSFLQLLLIFGLLYGIKLFLNIDFENEVLDASKQYRGLPYPTTANKLLIIYILFLLSYSLYKSSFIKYSLIVLSFLPFFYSVTLPSIAGIAVFIVLFSIINKKLKIKQWEITTNECFYILIGVIFLIIYTYLLPFKNSEELKIQIYSIKTYIVLFVETIIKIFLEYFIVFFLLIFCVIKTKGRIVFNTWFLISIVGLLAGFVFIYIHSPSIFNLHQVLSNISPVLLLLMSMVLIDQMKEKKISYFVFVLFGFSLWNLTYFKQIPNEFGMRKSSTTFSKEFQKNVTNFIDNSKSNIVAVSFRTIYDDEFRAGDNSSWKYDFQNKFQDLYYSRNISFPLELGALINNPKREIDYTQPYFKRFKDKKITNERIAQFIFEKKVDVMFVEKSVELSPIIASNYCKLFSDQLTGDSFWVCKQKNKK